MNSDDIECHGYEELLKEFAELCEGLVVAVILCHELYRFLHPLEPYVNLKNKD